MSNKKYLKRRQPVQKTETVKTNEDPRLKQTLTVGMIEPHLQVLYRDIKKNENGLENYARKVEELIEALVELEIVSPEKLQQTLMTIRERKSQLEARERETYEKVKASIQVNAQALFQRLANGELWEEVVKESACPSREKGGDLGWIVRASVTQEFALQVWNFEIGRVMPPFFTRHGWHIAQVLEEKKDSGQRHVRHILVTSNELVVKHPLPILPEKA